MDSYWMLHRIMSKILFSTRLSKQATAAKVGVYMESSTLFRRGFWKNFQIVGWTVRPGLCVKFVFILKYSKCIHVSLKTNIEYITQWALSPNNHHIGTFYRPMSTTRKNLVQTEFISFDLGLFTAYCQFLRIIQIGFQFYLFFISNTRFISPINQLPTHSNT